MAVIYIHSIDLIKDSGTITKGDALYPSETLYPSENLYPGGESFVDTIDPEVLWDGSTYTIPNTGELPIPPIYTSEIVSSIKLPKWYPHVGQEIATPKNKILIKKLTIEGEGSFDAEVYRTDYKTTISKSHEESSIRDLDLHVNSRVDRCDLTVSDRSTADFRIKSFVIEGIFKPSRTLK